MEKIHAVTFTCNNCNAIIKVDLSTLRNEKLRFSNCPVCNLSLQGTMEWLAENIVNYNQQVEQFYDFLDKYTQFKLDC